MPIFDTPEPISVTISINAGDARVVASDRIDTVVTVSPTDRSNESDVQAAEQTRIELSLGRLLIKAPKNWRQYTPFGSPGSVDVTIELPAGSDVEADTWLGDFRGEGRLGGCRFTTGTGHVWLDETGPLHLRTGTGRIIVDRTGPAELTGAGEIRVREIDGPATIKNINGDTWIGDITGDLRCNASNGDIVVARAGGNVDAKSANGNIRVGDVAPGSVSLQTAFGELEVGVREGTAALLDVRTQFGNVRNELSATAGPAVSDDTLEVRARTSHGDILIRRS